MRETIKYITELLLKFRNQALNEEEQDELIDWVNRSAANRWTFELLNDPDRLRERLGLLRNKRQAIWDKLAGLLWEPDSPAAR